MRPRRLWSSGLALEVRDLVGLGVGLLLRAAELVLGVALALLLLALAAQAGVVREVACSLLRASGDLVHDAHVLCLLCDGCSPLICALARFTANRPGAPSRPASRPAAARPARAAAGRARRSRSARS